MNEKNLPFSPTVVRSDRKTLALKITREGALIVQAPRRATVEEIARAIEKHRAWIEKNQISQKERAAAHPPLSAAEEAALRKRAKEILPQKLAFYAQIMGVSPTRLTITGAKTRFGSCSAKNAISFSFYLMQYPDSAVDYVVVHELAHIRHHDHSPAFWAEVEKWMPDYKERKVLLKQ